MLKHYKPRWFHHTVTIKSAKRHIQNKRIEQFFSRHWEKLMSLLLIILVIIGAITYIQYTFFWPKDIILKVIITKDSSNIYENEKIFKEIIQTLQGKNYYLTRYRNKNIWENEIIKQFPIIQEIQLGEMNQQILPVSIQRKEPDMTIINGDSEYMIIGRELIQKWSWHLLWSKSLKIHLPLYMSWIQWTWLNGIFAHIGPLTLLSQVSTIKSNIPNIDKISYIPWWKKIIIHKKNNMIYFDMMKPLNEQILKLQLLEKNYSLFHLITEIDLWSNEHIIIKQNNLWI